MFFGIKIGKALLIPNRDAMKSSAIVITNLSGALVFTADPCVVTCEEKQHCVKIRHYEDTQLGTKWSHESSDAPLSGQGHEG